MTNSFNRKKLYSAPTSLNLEITDKCNVKCRHCYNYWREEGIKTESMTKQNFDRLLELIVDSKIFHVILTGGEPFFNFELLEYACSRLVKNNISISVNTNLIMSSEDKIKRLSAAGVDHILTSLNSYDEKTNDFLSQRKGAFKNVIKGIKSAIKNNIRISVNMIIGQKNKDHVYHTGKFVRELGCQKLFGTRTVPPVSYRDDPMQSEFKTTKEDILYVLDQLVRVKADTGIMIGTLVSYPLCLLSNLEKYKDFVGRGCPSQAGHRMSLNADGESHCCVHEEKRYGNVFEIGIKKAYQNMLGWHNRSYRYPQCDGCRYIEICESGCRMSSLGYYRAMNARDPLMINKNNFTKHFKFVDENKFSNKISLETIFFVPQRLRFRKENGFYLVNIQWANTIEVNNETAEFLIKYQLRNKPFTINEFGKEKKILLIQLLAKRVVEAGEDIYSDTDNLSGLGIDPAKLR
ncbi:MAG TPA: radical SAM/SPASM domain-containing protein [Candidatus Wunengus sp. YC60]|uniref:radical SAM/SPASM domain-containing protein n=1 Tax=Candidatus Wunengus sp. YC60 TaxID=3367697 RepID=UPI0040294AE1